MSERQVRVVREQEQEALTFPWGAIKWLCNQELDPEAVQTFGLVHILPGERNPVHYHPNCDELLYVLAGECEHSLEEETVHLTAGSLIRIPAGARHNAVNRGWQPVQMVICYSSADRQTIFVEEGREEE
jgi:quercetin dioxygenase-like cupin family protein